jgi:hypothetical protein
MNGIASQVRIQEDESFTKQQELGYFLSDMLYQQYPNILTPSVAAPLQAHTDKRFTEKLDPKFFVNEKLLVPLNPSCNQGNPLRHAFLF